LIGRDRLIFFVSAHLDHQSCDDSSQCENRDDYTEYFQPAFPSRWLGRGSFHPVFPSFRRWATLSVVVAHISLETIIGFRWKILFHENKLNELAVISLDSLHILNEKRPTDEYGRTQHDFRSKNSQIPELLGVIHFRRTLDFAELGKWAQARSFWLTCAAARSGKKGECGNNHCSKNTDHENGYKFGVEKKCDVFCLKKSTKII
jgi:hypothetical protein